MLTRSFRSSLCTGTRQTASRFLSPFFSASSNKTGNFLALAKPFSPCRQMQSNYSSMVRPKRLINTIGYSGASGSIDIDIFRGVHTAATMAGGKLAADRSNRPGNISAGIRSFSKFKNPKSPRPLKTRQAAAKRFIKTGKGKLKHGHSGKAHLNTGKSRVRLARLNTKIHLTGRNFRNMNKLLLTGK
mmetsp:Transcript_17079/g.28920  ORF Transcript_17079/g.28920 Transcript_17079/m.28920 type:complete len:187 (+) Transcript_17079:51-611(+)